MPRSVDLDDVIMVARKLAVFDKRIAFTGGSIIALLLDHPDLTPIRPTNDVDVIAAVFTAACYTGC